MYFHVQCWHVFQFVTPCDLWLRQCAVPVETSELIERAVSHYLLAKQSRGGVKDITPPLWQTQVVLNLSLIIVDIKFSIPYFSLHFGNTQQCLSIIGAFSLLSNRKPWNLLTTFMVFRGHFPLSNTFVHDTVSQASITRFPRNFLQITMVPPEG